MAYRVIKTVKGRRYIYEQRTWREGKRVRTESLYIGPADGGPKRRRLVRKIADFIKANMKPRHLAQNMRMEVIAEGVESFEQVLHLRDLGIRAAQGFVFSPPLPCSAYLQLVETIDPIKSGGEISADGPADAIAAIARNDAA